MSFNEELGRRIVTPMASHAVISARGKLFIMILITTELSQGYTDQHKTRLLQEAEPRFRGVD